MSAFGLLTTWASERASSYSAAWARQCPRVMLVLHGRMRALYRSPSVNPPRSVQVPRPPVRLQGRRLGGIC
jgi:hypothetical protein